MDRLTTAQLLSTTDARVWAREFYAVWTELKVMDEGWLIGWFANAIETGRDAGKLQSLSQEAVRDEVLEDVEHGFEAWWSANGWETHSAHSKAVARTVWHAALKREPNAAGQVADQTGEGPQGDTVSPPAPAAPDVAEMVKDYPNLYMMLHGAVSGHYTEWPLMRKELTALLARLGQGWVQASEDEASTAYGALWNERNILQQKNEELIEFVQKIHDLAHARWKKEARAILLRVSATTAPGASDD